MQWVRRVQTENELYSHDQRNRSKKENGSFLPKTLHNLSIRLNKEEQAVLHLAQLHIVFAQH